MEQIERIQGVHQAEPGGSREKLRYKVSTLSFKVSARRGSSISIAKAYRLSTALFSAGYY